MMVGLCTGFNRRSNHNSHKFPRSNDKDSGIDQPVDKKEGVLQHRSLQESSQE